MAWKNQRKVHIGDQVWYYAITKSAYSECRDVIIKSPDGKVYQYNARFESVTPSVVKNYIEEKILGGPKLRSKG